RRREPPQDVVRIASAGGKQVGHALLAAVVGLDDTALASALRPAVAANVLLAGSDGYSFRHALIREAVHDELLAMLSRVLELWDRVPDAADRIGADHVAVLEAAIGTAELAGEYERGMALARRALKEVDAGAEPVRAALLHSLRG